MTTPDLGPAVSSDNAFKARARLHQSWFRAEVLGHPAYRDYGSRLTQDAALAGDNFYRRWPGMLDAVNGRVGLSDKKLCWDMLASDHIPYNFFIPMRGQSWAVELVRGWVGPSASKITAIEIEWAPEPAADFLGDSTSFDAYVTYQTTEGKRGAVGIETKFTEGPYSWGNTEHAQMHDDGSRYLTVTRDSKAFVEDALVQLRTPKLKQLWRNQLRLPLRHRTLLVHLRAFWGVHQSGGGSNRASGNPRGGSGRPRRAIGSGACLPRSEPTTSFELHRDLSRMTTESK